MSPEQLPEAAIRKQDGYSPLVEALAHYTDSRWIVYVSPWVVSNLASEAFSTQTLVLTERLANILMVVTNSVLHHLHARVA